jgi:hypothetical protein
LPFCSAALQQIQNPVPRVKHPDWLLKLVRDAESRFKQKDVRSFFTVRDKNYAFASHPVDVEKDIEDILPGQCSAGPGTQRGVDQEQEPILVGKNAPDMTEDVSAICSSFAISMWIDHRNVLVLISFRSFLPGTRSRRSVGSGCARLFPSGRQRRPRQDVWEPWSRLCAGTMKDWGKDVFSISYSSSILLWASPVPFLPGSTVPERSNVFLCKSRDNSMYIGTKAHPLNR